MYDVYIYTVHYYLQDPHTLQVVNKKEFLPKGKVSIGLTSGASTPDAYMQKVRVTAIMLVSLSLFDCLLRTQQAVCLS
jgi:hypothetical protein